MTTVNDLEWTTEYGRFIGNAPVPVPGGDPRSWYEVPLPSHGLKAITYRLLHRCRPHSVGVQNWEVIERCICGASRFGTTDLHAHRWLGPDRGRALDYRITSPWQDRNSRYTGTAMLYFPHLRPLESENPS